MTLRPLPTVVPELVGCPECDETAEVTDRFVLDSTSGPLEHTRVRCMECRRTYILITR